MLLRLHNSPPAPPAEQMALDETLLAGATDGGAWLRFYRWDAPAVTFGYAQRWRNVALLVPGGNASRAARRPTGGGVVFHGDDLTFSAGFPAPAAWNPSALYAALHERLLRALAGAGIGAALHRPVSAPPPAPDSAAGPLQCFASPVPMDLMTPDGRQKLLGGALRRMSGRVLYQGTLRLVPGLPDTPALRGALADAWAGFLGCSGVAAAPAPGADAGLLAKYRSAEWTARR